MKTIAWTSIGLALVCAGWIAGDEIRRPQRMAVMNAVWPLSALYLSVVAAFGYRRFGRSKDEMSNRQHGGDSSGRTNSRTPSFLQVAIATSHCGAGCALADILCDFFIATKRISVFGSPLWAEFSIDLAGAWLLGIVFQYFSIKPMRDLSATQAIVAAVKADTLSIVAFQVGMYAWMALTYFVFFSGPHLTAFDPRYWLMMQIAMICGFATSFPMNWRLLHVGLKEAM
ncbi:MAG TPA: DUF4396 domain-containing protein [Terracidiphilus sp.]|nr:DUF4396 domain-containing protein [Terracidiphilus sp.]